MALVTLDQVKLDSGIAGNASDDMLQQLIDGCSAAADQEMNRSILAADYTAFFSGHDGQCALVLPQWPVNSIASVTVDGCSIPPRMNDGVSGFFNDNDSVVLAGYCFTRGRSNIKVTWNGGYATVPADIATAITRWVGQLYTLADKQGWRSKTLAGETVTLDTGAMPAFAKAALRNFMNPMLAG